MPGCSWSVYCFFVLGVVRKLQSTLKHTQRSSEAGQTYDFVYIRLIHFIDPPTFIIVIYGDCILTTLITIKKVSKRRK